MFDLTGGFADRGQQKDRQGEPSPSEPLQSVLIGGFDAFAEASCGAARMGAPSVPPGRYFRMHLVGYFEGIDSERAGFPVAAGVPAGSRERVPDHSWLSKTRARLPHEVHAAVFDWVLALIGARRATSAW